jgi:hypothetical protein
VSTKQIPGIYNPPYCDVTPSAFGAPVEQHLKQSSKLYLPKSLRRPRRKLYTHPTNGLPQHAELGGTENTKLIGGPPHPLANREPLLSRTANVGRLLQIQGPFRSEDQIEQSNYHSHNQYRSVQSQSLYNIVEETRRKEYRLSKLTRLGPNDFVVPNPNAASMCYIIPSVHAETMYRDRATEFRDDYTELPKIKDKPPFFTALRKGRNFDDYDRYIPEV